ncbi:MAG: DUF429 domain-containing protein [Candidatus Hadarchaeum sp.]|uniref:DUF429 domain-containing protein n=1 Tax=Candidatus Hadarchaeum sp. TaxID=2883567 RepID=UPI003D125367
MVKVIGIDLAGLESNPSGFSLLTDHELHNQIIYRDSEILKTCAASQPSVVAIDAPLSLPGRGSLREADLALIRRGFRVFPPNFGGMRSLTVRGMKLAGKIRRSGIEVIEVHPRTSGLILFGSDDRKKWVAGLRRAGFELQGGAGRHEIDAALAAVTGLLRLQGKTEEIGTEKEGKIIIPRARCSLSPLRCWRGWRRPRPGSAPPFSA